MKSVAIIWSIFILLLVCHAIVSAQARLVLNSGAFVVINDSAYVVLENSSPNAITTLGSGGNIISEEEFNRIKWNIGDDTGTYVIPYARAFRAPVPFSMEITSAGTGSGNILFSTYAGPNWNDSLYMPGDVTNMTSTCCINNSAYVLDRFWIVDAQGYTTKPTVNMQFGYLDIEWNETGNTITETDLFAQRFNDSIGEWGDWYGTFNTDNATNRTVNSGIVTPSNLFRSWTLVDDASPLPIELLYFNANCDNDSIVLTWSTAIEVNNRYFTIERSSNGVNWEPVAYINGAGNSTEVHNYSWVDNTPIPGGQSVWYYRLEQTDFNGNTQYFNIVTAGCEQGIDLVNIYPNPAHGYLYYVIGSSSDNVEVEVSVYDMLGRRVKQESLTVQKGTSTYLLDVSLLASAIYNIQITTSNNVRKSQKEFVLNQ